MKFLALVLTIILVIGLDTVSARKFCGPNLFRKIFEVCPLGCVSEDPSFATKMCSFVFNEQQLRDKCCPA